MPLFDVECNECNRQIANVVILSGEKYICPYCGGTTRTLITLSEKSFDPEPVWLKSVLDVVEKDSGKPHTEAFLREPTRQNYHNWMKGEGIRPMEKEHGAFRTEREKPKTDMSRVVKGLVEKRMQRNRIYFTG